MTNFAVATVDTFVMEEIQTLRLIHERDTKRRRQQRIAMKREKKSVHDLFKTNPTENYWRYCKRPFAHHKRDERIDHRLLQANAYPIRTQLQEMYEDEYYEEESMYQVDESYGYDTMAQSFETDTCDYEYEELFWEENENDDWYEDLFWGDDEECARFDDAATCPISEEVIEMEMDIAYRQMMEQEVSECHDWAVKVLREEMQLEELEYEAMLEHYSSKTMHRRHRKANILEKGYIAMLDEKVNSKAKEEGRKPENFRRQSKRPHSRRYEERERMHSRVDHRTACANAYPVAVQLRDMYEEMCA